MNIVCVDGELRENHCQRICLKNGQEKFIKQTLNLTVQLAKQNKLSGLENALSTFLKRMIRR